MIDIKNVYDKYLLEENDMKKMVRDSQSMGRLSASSAGLCAKKLWYQKHDVQPMQPDPESLRVMKLGTIVGYDFDKAFDHKTMTIDDVTYDVHKEEYVYDEEYEIGGSFDLLLVNQKTKAGHLFDYKTCNSWKWKMMFGQMKNRDSNPSNNYEFQLGTYGLILDRQHTFCDGIESMTLVYYNKDKSTIRQQEVHMDYIELAEKYWRKAREIANQDQEPSNNELVPYYSWECGKYCSYLPYCDSVYKKEK